MKKLYLCLLSFLLAVMLAVGTFTVYNFIMISEKTPFSLEGLQDGTQTTAWEDTFANAFAGRSLLLKGSRYLNHFYYFSPLDENVLTMEYHGGAELGGERLKPEDPLPPVQETKPSVPVVEAPEENEVTAIGTIVIHGNRAMDIPAAEPEIIPQYSAAVNRLADAAGEKVRTFSLVTPNSGQFYSPGSYHTGKHDQKAMLELYQTALSDKVIAVDAYTPLSVHSDEYVFFRTDHHWTQKGAYYAYTAFCESAGFPCAALESYQSGSYEGFVGSMYHYTAGYPQSEALRQQPDTLTYYLPKAKSSARYYLDGSLSYHYSVAVVDTALDSSVGNKYLCYINGDTPICIIDTDAKGGTCMVLKESYGNAFLPFLAEHYSRIIAVDPREFNHDDKPSLDLVSFWKENPIDDLLILNYPFMLNSKTYIQRLNSLIPS